MKKRNRACEECQRLKIKCDVSTTLSWSCDRCRRNNLECVPAAPRLQRDRIVELEALVHDLELELQSQRTSTSSGQSPGSSQDQHEQAVLSFLDARIARQHQQKLLLHYTRHAGAAWPVVRVSTDLEYLRAKSPILLLSILVCTTTQQVQGTELETHDKMIRELTRILGEEVVGRGQRSLELVQALLVTAFWNKAPRQGSNASCYVLSQLAGDMAIDIGIAGYVLQPSPAAYFDRHEDPTALEARRTWLACFMAASTSSISIRRPTMIPWNAHHEECLLDLEARGDASDMLLCQLVRITYLIQEIDNRLGLCHLGIFHAPDDYATHAIMASLVAQVDAWEAQIPSSLASSQTLKVMRHVAMIHIYEPVIHTPTNKGFFAAPYIPGRIMAQDFPHPLAIIPPVHAALNALIQHCHAVVDIAVEMDPQLVLDLPTFCFAPKIIYSTFVLVKVFVASTDPLSTYSQCVSRDQFQFERCGLRLRGLTAQLKALDPTLSCFTTRLIDATTWLEQWKNDFSNLVQQYEMSFSGE